MVTPGQVVTNDSAVLREIVSELITIDGLNTGNVFISAEPIFLASAYPGDQYVEVVPGGALDVLSKAGDGYIRADFRIIVFKRLLLDIKRQDTELIASASLGLFALVQTITDKLTQNYLKLLVVPLRPIRRTSASSGPVIGAGWSSTERVFEATYLGTFSEPSNFS